MNSSVFISKKIFREYSHGNFSSQRAERLEKIKTQNENSSKSESKEKFSFRRTFFLTKLRFAAELRLVILNCCFAQNKGFSRRENSSAREKLAKMLIDIDSRSSRPKSFLSNIFSVRKQTKLSFSRKSTEQIENLVDFKATRKENETFLLSAILSLDESSFCLNEASFCQKFQHSTNELVFLSANPTFHFQPTKLNYEAKKTANRPVFSFFFSIFLRKIEL